MLAVPDDCLILKPRKVTLMEMLDATRIIMLLNMPLHTSLKTDHDPYQQPLSGGPVN